MRCNQDNQREYEERCFRRISQHLLHENSNSNAECSSGGGAMLTSSGPIDVGQRSGNKGRPYITSRFTVFFFFYKTSSLVSYLFIRTSANEYLFICLFSTVVLQAVIM